MAFKDRVKAVLNACLLWCWIMTGLFAAFFGILSPFHTWLEDGVFPDRDLLWWLSDSSCYATDWVAKGIAGKDACKLVYVLITDMVGLNKIYNWFLDLHLVGVWGLLSILILWFSAHLSE